MFGYAPALALLNEACLCTNRSATPTPFLATHALCTAPVRRAVLQIVMAVFSWIYYTNYVAKSAASVAAGMSAVLKLGPQQLVVLDQT